MKISENNEHISGYAINRGIFFVLHYWGGGGMSKKRCCHGNSAFTPYFQKLSVYCIHQSILHILGEFQLPSRLFYRDITVEGQGPGKSNILRK